MTTSCKNCGEQEGTHVPGCAMVAQAACACPPGQQGHDYTCPKNSYRSMEATLVRAEAAKAAPQEHPLAAAIKQQYLTMLEQPLDTKQAIRIARFAASSVKVLKAVATGVDGLGAPRRRSGYVSFPNPDPDGIEGVEGEAGDYAGFPIAPSPGGIAENFGNGMVREAIALLPQLLGARKTSDLVTSISMAKTAGLDEVAKKLEAELDAQLTLTAKPVALPAAPPPPAQQVLFACPEGAIP